MKNPRSLIAACFAGAGVYLIVTSVIGLFFGIMTMIPLYVKYPGGAGFLDQLWPIGVMAIAPAVAGIVLIYRARSLAGIVMQKASLSENENLLGEISPGSVSTLRAFLAGFGVFQIIGSFTSALVSAFYVIMFFSTRSAARDSAFANPSLAPLVPAILGLIAGGALVLFSHKLSVWLHRKVWKLEIAA